MDKSKELELNILKAKLKVSRNTYKELVEETIKEHLHKKTLKAIIHMYNVNDGLANGKQYRAKHYGQNLIVKRVICVIDPLTKHIIDTLNLLSMESIEPTMVIEVETEKGDLVQKEITYYAVKQFIDNECIIDPNEYEF